jgi:glycerophosphoryl diester phosphodiesterase
MVPALPWPPGVRPLVLGHRGASARAPENTIAAARLARLEGADGVEIDVHATRDGALVVFHDDTFDRLAGDPRRVADLDLADVRALRVDGESIPTLDEMIDETAGLILNVELKPDRTPALESATAACLARTPAARVLVSSFDVRSLRRFRRHAPRVPIGLLTEPGQPSVLRRRRAGDTLGLSALHSHVSSCDEALVARARAANLAVVAWTVDDAAELLRLRDLGVDVVIADDPGRARRVLGR